MIMCRPSPPFDHIARSSPTARERRVRCGGAYQSMKSISCSRKLSVPGLPTSCILTVLEFQAAYSHNNLCYANEETD